MTCLICSHLVEYNNPKIILKYASPKQRVVNLRNVITVGSCNFILQFIASFKVHRPKLCRIIILAVWETWSYSTCPKVAQISFTRLSPIYIITRVDAQLSKYIVIWLSPSSRSLESPVPCRMLAGPPP